MKLRTLSFLSVFALLLAVGCGDRAGVDATAGDRPASSDREVTQIEDRRVRIIKRLEEPSTLDRVEGLIAEMRSLPESEVETIHEVLRDSDLKFRDLERVLLVARWAEIDPYQASEWAFRGERGSARHAAIETAGKMLATQDPEALIQNYDVEKLGAKIPSLLTALVEGWADSGVDGLDTYVRGLSDQELRQIAEKELVRVRVSRLGEEAAIEWAEELRGSERNKNHLYRQLGGEVAKLEPELAVEFCRKYCDLPIGKWMTQEIARSWGRRDGAAMMDWLITRPDVQETWVAARIGYREFVIADRDGAGEWMEQTTEEQRQMDILEGPISMWANVLAGEDPTGAMEWVEYLNEENKRGMHLGIARRWMRSDEEAARAWVEQSPLSEEDREKVYKVVTGPANEDPSS